MRNKSLLSLSKELKILHLASLEKELTQKTLKENDLNFQDPLDLLNLGYLSITGNKDFPYCGYKITEEGKEYSEDISKLINDFPHKKLQL